MKPPIFTLGICLLFFSNSYGQCQVDKIYINAYLVDPTGTSDSFDTDGDGITHIRDEFIQICNDSSGTVYLNGFTISDTVGVRFSFGPSDSLLAGQCLNVISDWINTSPTIPSNFRETGTSGGGPFWNNDGDSIYLSNGSETCYIAYGSLGSDAGKDGCTSLYNSSTNSYAMDCSLTPADLSNSPLPVELIRFTGRALEEQIRLEWSTASEHNNDYFNIEKSVDGHQFTSIGTENGHGNSERLLNYVFTDDNPSKINYYRLKQVDYDGKISTSKVIKVVSKLENYAIVNSHRVFEVVFNEKMERFYCVSNLSGQVLAFGKFEDDLRLTKTNYHDGLLILSIKSEDGVLRFKVVTQ